MMVLRPTVPVSKRFATARVFPKTLWTQSAVRDVTLTSAANGPVLRQDVEATTKEMNQDVIAELKTAIPLSPRTGECLELRIGDKLTLVML